MTTHRAESIALPVEVLPPDVLRRRALADFKRVTGTSARELTAAILVNFIRHKLTPYDAALKTLPAVDDVGYDVIGTRVLDNISSAYRHMPVIAAEAQRQKARRKSAPPSAIRTWRAS